MKQIDLGLMIPPVNDKSLLIELLLQEPLVVVLPETHLLAKESELTLSALADEPFILVPRHLEPGYYDQCISLFQQAGFRSKGCSESESETNDSRFSLSRYGSFFSTCLNL
jgi:DNA-binding transcriptional LysR family regulator